MRYVFFRYLRKYLSGIVTYIAERLKNPEAANELIGDVENAVMKRKQLRGKFLNHVVQQKERKYPYYRIYAGSYIVYYAAIDNTMEVRRILYNKRDKL